ARPFRSRRSAAPAAPPLSEALPRTAWRAAPRSRVATPYSGTEFPHVAAQQFDDVLRHVLGLVVLRSIAGKVPAQPPRAVGVHHEAEDELGEQMRIEVRSQGGEQCLGSDEVVP